MLPIAYSEFAQIFRNRTVLTSNLVMPLAASAFFVYRRDTFAQIGSLGFIAAVLVFTVGAFSLYTTAATTLSPAGRTCSSSGCAPPPPATRRSCPA